MPASQSSAPRVSVPPKPKLLSKLPPRQRAFLEQFMLHLNATRAYRDVYEVSEAVAAANGSRLLGNAKVSAALAELQERRSQRLEVQADEIVTEFDRLALSDQGDIWDLNADELRMKPMKDWPIHARRAVASIKVKRYPVQFPEMNPERIARLDAIARAGESSPYVEPMPPEDRAFLSRLAEDLRNAGWGENEILEIKLWDKNSALEKAGKHRRLFHEAKKDGTREGDQEILVVLDF